MQILNKYSLLLVALLLTSCFQKKQEPLVAPWGVIDDTITVADDFDLHDIQTSGELIMATVSGPETYYDYHGKSLGTQYLLCQRFADSLGCHLRVDVCRDSLELVHRLDSCEADLIAWPTPGHIEADRQKPDLAATLKSWYRPELIAEVKAEENALLTTKKVRRRIFSPMLDAKGGIISPVTGCGKLRLCA